MSVALHSQQIDGGIAAAVRQLESRRQGAADAILRYLLLHAPGHTAAVDLLETVQVGIANRLAHDAAGPSPRYLVIKAWGYGMWSEIAHIVGCCLLAEVTGRIPVVDWGRGSLFYGKDGADPFPAFFQPVSGAVLWDARAPGLTVYPPKWAGRLAEDRLSQWEGDGSRLGAADFLGRAENVVVADFFIAPADVAAWLPPGHPLYGVSVETVFRSTYERYLHPSAGVGDRVSAVWERLGGGAGPMAAVHIRGTDKDCRDSAGTPVWQRYSGLIDRLPADIRLLLLTDDDRHARAFQERYPSRTLLTGARRSGGAMPLHYDTTLDRVDVGREVIADVLLALRADAFIGIGPSNVSAAIAALRQWKEACFLFGRSVLLDPNPSIYMIAEP